MTSDIGFATIRINRKHMNGTFLVPIANHLPSFDQSQLPQQLMSALDVKYTSLLNLKKMTTASLLFFDPLKMPEEERTTEGIGRILNVFTTYPSR
jgi:hypothetical protein